MMSYDGINEGGMRKSHRRIVDAVSLLEELWQRLETEEPPPMGGSRLVAKSCRKGVRGEDIGLRSRYVAPLAQQRCR